MTLENHLKAFASLTSEFLAQTGKGNKMQLGFRFMIAALALSSALMVQAEDFNPTFRSLTAAEWQTVAERYCSVNWPDPEMQRACISAAAVDPERVSALPEKLLAVLRATVTKDSLERSGAWPYPEPPMISEALESLGLDSDGKEIGFKQHAGGHGMAYGLVEVRPCADLRNNQGSSFYIVSVQW